MTKEIPLTQGKFAIIDDDDCGAVSQYKWYTSRRKNTCYAVRNDYTAKPPKKVYLHRILIGAGDGDVVDHVNGNGLDCRKVNLRICTTAQNQMNMRMNQTNKAGYKGVHLHKESGKWCARISINGKPTHVGLFTSAKQAARAYDKAAIECYGEFAKTNF